ncbi:hypothetical protein LEP1GSC202_0232 [Leptospira yanagawae serovar Saopaulo str. Sao Paulo = ATCC 700523]|uniref:Uncharacterized protein n=1 Tax=Leptospira yanagawae serovar Saopaulo str. Sao Paulo = ATCC 700523 TaxID=1249483 RepID=A0A5E8H846_9LEPT|nr:hypothetical protein [Leptospira yanagawae]EOQ86887.1 hypothetical protein LEP1GSC202_0232 [Leptospira yanagawae serovar Saopaulo str. Sao Paulo = ATCC 700523]
MKLKITSARNTEVVIFENQNLVYFRAQNPNDPTVRNYPYIDTLNQNPSTNYKWSISYFDYLIQLIQSLRSANKHFLDYFMKPKVLVIFPEDIFESERVFLRSLFAELAREIYLAESFHVCQLSVFSFEHLMGKKILTLGERLNQSFTHIENSELMDSELITDLNEKMQCSQFDLIISHKTTNKIPLNDGIFLEGEELRKHLIVGAKMYLDFLNI